MLGWHPKQTLCMKQSSGIGRGHGRSKAAVTIRAQKQEIKDLKARAAALEAEIKEVRTINDALVANIPESKKMPTNLQPGPELDRKFYTEWKELNKERVFVRIADLRRQVNIPRKAFDEELRRLRDTEIVQIHIGDNTFMTAQDIQDSFVDELGKLMGTITWEKKV